jgi:hypothetical protein
MDLKRYYQRIREIESTIADAFTLVVSIETPDGGKPGTLTEVIRKVAAKMVVDGVARLATAEETERWRDAQAEAQRLAEQATLAGRVQLSVVPTSELNRLREAARPAED